MVQFSTEPLPFGENGGEAARAFVGTRLQGAQRLKLGGKPLLRAGGEALSIL